MLTNCAADGDIGSSSLPAMRPLCIPVRFQPLGGATPSRWMGTGALAAAASALPPPLPACDEGSDPFDRTTLSAGGSGSTWACAPLDDACGLEPPTAATTSGESGQVAGSSRLADRPWLWPLVVALVLALVILGGGAAWATWQKHRRRQAATASADTALPHQAAPNALPLSPAPAMPMVQTRAAPPTSPLFHSPYPYDAMAPLSYGAQPATSVAAVAPEPHQAPLSPTQQQQLQAPASPLAQVPQQQPTAQVTQARGTYVMVERPPLRMRNVAVASRRHDDSDNDDDDDDDSDGQGRGLGESGRRAPVRSVASGPRGGDAWVQRTFARRPVASPQESHRDVVHPIIRQPPAPTQRDGLGSAMGNARGQIHGTTTARSARPPGEPLHQGHGNGHVHSLADDDSLGEGVDDYWANAERARQSYFASPEERAAQVMRLGAQAYSPDGTPMPARSY
ncbi:hypothetical protein psal_cds_317 [Pandoravirus salinus]|uniref:Uncharacterized protein n=1 Tax=Pandoravirus salinus TaxID=1349410 RepID=S4W1D8_9VIRU|nr:DNA transclocase FtsK incomplete domain [Pandoravirus salinus]AGO83935.1 hypothetical protein psal_cds_317 [Pandoravirus salinus]